MHATSSAAGSRLVPRGRRAQADRYGDRLLHLLTILAALLAVAVIVAVVYKLIDGASQAIGQTGVGFVTRTTWSPATNVFTAGAFVFGTLVTSGIALLFAAPIGIACGLYLSLLAPPRAATIITPLVEMLAAIPSVILGLWGIIVVGPFLRDHVEPALHSVLGFIPLFGTPGATPLSVFNAIVILTIMVVPIIAAISRELFTNVPSEQQEAALALGATRWEMVRGVVLSSTRSGLMAAAILGVSRALGEAIAVTQVIGGGAGSSISANLFNTGDTLASRIANQFPDAAPGVFLSSIFYLAVILLIIELIVNLVAQLIVRNYEREHGTAH